MDNKFIKSWIVKGENETEVVNRFVSYYIAFNYLYNQYKNKYEPDKIKTLLNDMKDNLKEIKMIINNNFEINKKVVMNMKNGKECTYYRLKEVKSKNIIAIFMAIYQIRCNLFHGSKFNPRNSNSRDYKLIEESIIILQKFFKIYLDIKK